MAAATGAALALSPPAGDATRQRHSGYMSSNSPPDVASVPTPTQRVHAPTPSASLRSVTPIETDETARGGGDGDDGNTDNDSDGRGARTQPAGGSRAAVAAAAAALLLSPSAAKPDSVREPSPVKPSKGKSGAWESLLALPSGAPANRGAHGTARAASPHDRADDAGEAAGAGSVGSGTRTPVSTTKASLTRRVLNASRLAGAVVAGSRAQRPVVASIEGTERVDGDGFGASFTAYRLSVNDRRRRRRPSLAAAGFGLPGLSVRASGSYTIRRRYSEFVELTKALGSEVGRAPSTTLPAKTLFSFMGSSSDVVAARSASFGTLLWELTDPTGPFAASRALEAFLKPDADSAPDTYAATPGSSTPSAPAEDVRVTPSPAGRDGAASASTASLSLWTERGGARTGRDTPTSAARNGVRRDHIEPADSAAAPAYATASQSPSLPLSPIDGAGTDVAAPFPAWLQANPHFGGRSEEVDRARSLLRASDEDRSVHGNVIAFLAPFAGAGKTELATQLAMSGDMDGMYPAGVFWIHGNRIAAGMRAILRELCAMHLSSPGLVRRASFAATRRSAVSDSEVRAAVHEYFERTAGWLLVVDGVDHGCSFCLQSTPATRSPYGMRTAQPSEDEPSAAGWLPRASAPGHVVVTSRLSQRELVRTGLDLPVDRCISVPALNTEASVKVLRASGKTGREREAARTMASAGVLGGVPLALHHAAAYVEVRRTSLVDCAHTLHGLVRDATGNTSTRKTGSLPATPTAVALSRVPRCVALTTELCIDAVTADAPDAAALLQLLAALAPNAPVPWIVCHKWAVTLADASGDSDSSHETVRAALSALGSYGLVALCGPSVGDSGGGSAAAASGKLVAADDATVTVPAAVAHYVRATAFGGATPLSLPEGPTVPTSAAAGSMRARVQAAVAGVCELVGHAVKPCQSSAHGSVSASELDIARVLQCAALVDLAEPHVMALVELPSAAGVSALQLAHLADMCGRLHELQRVSTRFVVSRTRAAAAASGGAAGSEHGGAATPGSDITASLTSNFGLSPERHAGAGRSSTSSSSTVRGASRVMRAAAAVDACRCLLEDAGALA